MKSINLSFESKLEDVLLSEEYSVYGLYNHYMTPSLRGFIVDKIDKPLLVLSDFNQEINFLLRTRFKLKKYARN